MRKFFICLLIAAAALAAYVLGAQAGQKRYREITATVDAIWNDPRVKKARKRARKQADQAIRSATRTAKKIGR